MRCSQAEQKIPLVTQGGGLALKAIQGKSSTMGQPESSLIGFKVQCRFWCHNQGFLSLITHRELSCYVQLLLSQLNDNHTAILGSEVWSL